MGVAPLRVLLCLALAQSCQADAVIDNLAVNDFYTNFAKPVDGFQTEAGAQGACLLDKANHIATFTTCHSDKGKLPKGAIRCSKDRLWAGKTVALASSKRNRGDLKSAYILVNGGGMGIRDYYFCARLRTGGTWMLCIPWYPILYTRVVYELVRCSR